MYGFVLFLIITTSKFTLFTPNINTSYPHYSDKFSVRIFVTYINRIKTFYKGSFTIYRYLSSSSFSSSSTSPLPPPPPPTPPPLFTTLLRLILTIDP